MSRKLSVVYRPLSELIPYARNARTHSDAQVAQIAASIREFGWTNPVLVDGERGIIAGHGRVLAARKLGIEEIPTIELGSMSDAQRRAYILADNKLALNAGWDEELLKVELSELKGLDFDLSVIGFDPGEIASIFLEKQQGKTDPTSEWQGMPEYDQRDEMPYRTLHVHFNNDEDVAEFARLIGQSVTDKTKYLWFPHQEIAHHADKRYAEDQDGSE